MYKIPAKTLFVGKNLVFTPECHSTNSLALELSHKAGTPEGSVVVTDHQTAGRGQMGNTWNAEPNKNLTFSIILYPSFLPASDQFLLNVVSSLTLKNLLSNVHGLPVKIKWPNDIMVDDKKIAGILIENTLAGNLLKASVIGIGLNINQKEFPFPTATSLLKSTDRSFDKDEQLRLLLEEFETIYVMLRAGKGEKLRDDYIRSLYWINENHTFQSNSTPFEGVIDGVDDAGRLLVSTQSKKYAFNTKEVRYIH